MSMLLVAATAASIAASEFRRYSAEICPTADVQAEFRVDAAAFAGETDAYRVSESSGGLVFVGRNGRSLLYAVYDYFRRYCGCAYFWDGDVVPKRGSLPVKGVSLYEQSRFEYRGCQYFAHRGLRRFQAEHWGLEDWKREIDWAVKNRLNLVMLRLGIEDLFQLAFPDVVPYPDVSVTEIPDAKDGYNYRTPFWSLQYRHALRRQVMDYLAERGLMHPVEYGTMTHWFARTPKAFLEKMKPDPLPQANANYAEPSGYVWDIRRERWRDAYWKLTEASVAAYGYSGLLFTPGFDERVVFTNRVENMRFKADVVKTFNREAAQRYPGARLFVEGWDFLYAWRPEEVREFVRGADPSQTVIFDFTADNPGHARASAEIPRDNNFTRWGVTNAFPYVFGFMLEFNPGSDVRANYRLIREREKAIRDDAMCKGYVIWPEASHTDIFAWRYFCDMSWSLPETPVDELLARFCRDRYGRQAEAMLGVWRQVVPFSSKAGWGRRFPDTFLEKYSGERNSPAFWNDTERLTGAVPSAELFGALAKIDWSGDFIRRDTIDLARTVLDRILYDGFWNLMREFHELGADAPSAAVSAFESRANRLVRLVGDFGDLLELHSDYSLAETLEATDRIEKLVNPRAEHLLFENAACDYCRSHHLELVRGWYQPTVSEICRTLVGRAKSGDRSPLPAASDRRQALRETDHPILAFRPDASKRTPERFREIMLRLQKEENIHEQ